MDGLEAVSMNTVRSAFRACADSPPGRFTVKLRRRRAEEVRRLLAAPDAVDVATFNRKVWPLERDTVLRTIGKRLNLTSEKLPEASVAEWDAPSTPVSLSCTATTLGARALGCTPKTK